MIKIWITDTLTEQTLTSIHKVDEMCSVLPKHLIIFHKAVPDRTGKHEGTHFQNMQANVNIGVGRHPE